MSRTTEDLQTAEISGASGWGSGGAVVWVTGISGAGKTTVCDALANLVGDQVPELVRIDGDVVREVFGAGLGYKAADREIQIGRVQRLSRVLAEQGKLVLVAALYASDDLLSWNREHLPGYFEVYLEASFDLVRSRDPKGLYRKADAGQMPDVVGIDVPWNAPKQPDLVIDASRPATPREHAISIARRIPRLSRVLTRLSLD